MAAPNVLSSPYSTQLMWMPGRLRASACRTRCRSAFTVGGRLLERDITSTAPSTSGPYRPVARRLLPGHATASSRVLPSRWVMSGDARLAYFYHAFGIAFLRRCYHRILGPRRHLPEFADGLCRHCNAGFHLNPHITWQATKSYV